MSEQQRHHHRHHSRKRHLGLKIFLSVLVLLVLLIGGITYGVYKSVENGYNNAYSANSKTTAVDFSKKQPFTTLLVLTGTTNNQKQVYATAVSSTNNQTKKTTILNFPVTDVLPDQTTINSIYSAGGTDGLLQSTQTMLGLKINKIINVNVNKMGELIETTGGVSIQNPRTFVSNGYKFNQGTLTLSTSDQVTAYLSQIDTNDQAAMITRLQNVSMALYQNIKGLTNKSNLKLNFNYYRNILYAFGDTVKTNISFNEFKQIALNYNKALTNTSKLNLHSSDQNGIQMISADELNNVKTLFEKTLK